MKKFIIAIAAMLVSSSAYSSDIKVVRTGDIIQNGENCKVMSEESAYRITAANANETLSKEIPLKQLIKDGWKINFVKELPSKYSSEFMIILIKD